MIVSPLSIKSGRSECADIAACFAECSLGDIALMVDMGGADDRLLP